MKKLIFILVAALGMSCTSYAQMTEKEVKKATKTAQKLVKEAKNDMERADVPNKSNAKRLVDQAMKNSLIQDWDQTWFIAATVYQHYYEQENIKSYNGAYDTVAMYKYLTDWYDFAIKADSLQQIPNAKGKTSDEVRKKMVPDIHRNLSTLINGGIFYFNHRQDYTKAYELFDRYFTLAQSEILADRMVDDKTWNENSTYFAYFPALSAYYNEEWDKTLKYALIAQDDEENGEGATEFICESYGHLGDSVKWIEALKAGMVKYPTKDYYYSKLLNYYSKQEDMSELEDFVTEMIKLDPEKAYNYYVMGYIAQSANDYEKAISQYEIAIEKNSELSDAYNNLGLCILSQAIEYMDSKSSLDYRSSAYKKALQEEKEYYNKALPYFKKLRELEPESINKWAVPLQTIYYKLNMQKELKEIETRMTEKGML